MVEQLLHLFAASLLQPHKLVECRWFLAEDEDEDEEGELNQTIYLILDIFPGVHIKKTIQSLTYLSPNTDFLKID